MASSSVPANLRAGSLSADPDAENIVLHVISPSFQPPSRVTLNNIPLTTTVSEVKARITLSLASRPPPETQRLIYRGKPLSDNNETLSKIVEPSDVCVCAMSLDCGFNYANEETSLGSCIFDAPCPSSESNTCQWYDDILLIIAYPHNVYSQPALCKHLSECLARPSNPEYSTRRLERGTNSSNLDATRIRSVIISKPTSYYTIARRAKPG